VASVTIVVGAIFGTVVGYLLEAVSAPAEVKTSEEAAVKAK